MRIDHVEIINNTALFYDITIDDTEHLFYITDANNTHRIESHNCDGYHILCLLVNLLFTYWPELFEGKPFVSKLKTPYLILKKGDKREYIYADKYDQFDGSKWKGWHITRAKGLGSLEFEDWVSVYDKPNIDHIMDDGSLKDTLDLLFNKTRADDRKIWLEIEE